MPDGHHHGPHLGHRPWPRRGVGAWRCGRVAVSARVGACLPRSSGRGRRLVRSIARTEDSVLAACLFSCHDPSGTGTPMGTPDGAWSARKCATLKRTVIYHLVVRLR